MAIDSKCPISLVTTYFHRQRPFPLMVDLFHILDHRWIQVAKPIPRYQLISSPPKSGDKVFLYLEKTHQELSFTVGLPWQQVSYVCQIRIFTTFMSPPARLTIIFWANESILGFTEGLNATPCNSIAWLALQTRFSDVKLPAELVQAYYGSWGLFILFLGLWCSSCWLFGLLALDFIRGIQIRGEHMKNESNMIGRIEYIFRGNSYQSSKQNRIKKSPDYYVLTIMFSNGTIIDWYPIRS